MSKDPASVEIGKRIAAARTSAGLTQDDLAAAALTSRASVARWEAGQLPIRTDDLFRTAEAIHVPVAYLLGIGDLDYGAAFAAGWAACTMQVITATKREPGTSDGMKPTTTA